MKVNGSTPLTLAAVKDILKAREKDSELGYEQKQAFDYADKFSKQDKKKAEELVEKVMENKKMTKEVAVTLVNVSPKHAATAKAIALKDKIDLTDEEAEEIIKLFN